jgi:DHA2 family multidrug resistance protein
MEELQNGEYVGYFLDMIKEMLNIPLQQVKAVFGNYEMFMGYNYGFYNTFMHAGYWGVFGTIFVVLLFVNFNQKRKKI